MARSQESYSKKEREKKRKKKNQEKRERREQRKLEKADGVTTSFEDMLSYVDEDGNLTDTPPDPSKRKKIKASDIVIGVPPKDDSIEETARQGFVKFFNDEKGYGFIIDSMTKESIFVHLNNLEEPVRQDNQVTFEIEKGPKGLSAINVKLVKE